MGSLIDQPTTDESRVIPGWIPSMGFPVWSRVESHQVAVSSRHLDYPARVALDSDFPSHLRTSVVNRPAVDGQNNPREGRRMFASTWNSGGSTLLIRQRSANQIHSSASRSPADLRAKNRVARSRVCKDRHKFRFNTSV